MCATHRTSAREPALLLSELTRRTEAKSWRRTDGERSDRNEGFWLSAHSVLIRKRRREGSGYTSDAAQQSIDSSFLRFQVQLCRQRHPVSPAPRIPVRMSAPTAQQLATGEGAIGFGPAVEKRKETTGGRSTGCNSPRRLRRVRISPPSASED